MFQISEIISKYQLIESIIVLCHFGESKLKSKHENKIRPLKVATDMGKLYNQILLLFRSIVDAIVCKYILQYVATEIIH